MVVKAQLLLIFFSSFLSYVNSSAGAEEFSYVLNGEEETCYQVHYKNTIIKNIREEEALIDRPIFLRSIAEVDNLDICKKECCEDSNCNTIDFQKHADVKCFLLDCSVECTYSTGESGKTVVALSKTLQDVPLLINGNPTTTTEAPINVTESSEDSEDSDNFVSITDDDDLSTIKATTSASTSATTSRTVSATTSNTPSFNTSTTTSGTISVTTSSKTSGTISVTTSSKTSGTISVTSSRTTSGTNEKSDTTSATTQSTTTAEKSSKNDVISTTTASITSKIINSTSDHVVVDWESKILADVANTTEEMDKNGEENEETREKVDEKNGEVEEEGSHNIESEDSSLDDSVQVVSNGTSEDLDKSVQNNPLGKASDNKSGSGGDGGPSGLAVTALVAGLIIIVAVTVISILYFREQVKRKDYDRIDYINSGLDS